MKSATVTEIKKELQHKSKEELITLCLSLSKFKKENKELLTYLLFEAHNEAGYIEAVQEEITEQLSLINKSSYYFMKKSIRKVLRAAKKYIRYSKKKETQVEVLLHFCRELKEMSPSIKRNTVLTNLYQRQFDLIAKTIGALHEDLQYDYNRELEELAI